MFCSLIGGAVPKYGCREAHHENCGFRNDSSRPFRRQALRSAFALPGLSRRSAPKFVLVMCHAITPVLRYALLCGTRQSRRLLVAIRGLGNRGITVSSLRDFAEFCRFFSSWVISLSTHRKTLAVRLWFASVFSVEQCNLGLVCGTVYCHPTVI